MPTVTTIDGSLARSPDRKDKRGFGVKKARLGSTAMLLNISKYQPLPDGLLELSAYHTSLEIVQQHIL
jgi:hypothetical protein